MSGYGTVKTRIAAVLLAAAVLLLLFCNWLVTGGETKKEWDEAKTVIERYVDEVESYEDWIGMDIDIKALTAAGRLILDGKLSPAELFRISVIGRNTLKTLYDGLGRYIMAEKDYYTVMMALGFYSVIFVFVVLSVLLSLFIRITGKLEKLDVLMIIFVGILFAVIFASSAALSSRGIRMDITVFSVLTFIFALASGLIGRLPFLRSDQ